MMSVLTDSLRAARAHPRRTVLVFAVQPVFGYAIAEIGLLRQFPAVFVMASALTASYAAGPLVGVVAGAEMFAFALAFGLNGSRPVTATGVVIGLIVIGSSCFALSRALARERDARQVSERARAQLAESEQRYRSLLESAFEAIVLSADGLIVELNAGFERLTGLTKAELIARPLGELLEPASPAAARDYVTDTPGEPLAFTLRAGDGSERLVMVFAKTVEYHGRAARLVGIDDVGERRRAVDARRAERRDVVGDSAGTAGHDLNNLLAVIGGNAHLLALGDLTEGQHEQAVEIANAAEGIAGLSRELLGYSQRRVVDAQDEVPERAHGDTGSSVSRAACRRRCCDCEARRCCSCTCRARDRRCRRRPRSARRA